MAPKKKGAKKAADDWEDDIGETIDPVAQAVERANGEQGANGASDDDEGGGGLLAALRKNRARKVKKGKAVEDVVGDDDPEDANGDAIPDLALKAPQEVTMDDEDVFGQPIKKGKKEKGSEPQEDDDIDASGKVKTKAQKEREKKEREKQRKKEQVRFTRFNMSTVSL
jgi:translation initiation factor 5B